VTQRGSFENVGHTSHNYDKKKRIQAKSLTYGISILT